MNTFGDWLLSYAATRDPKVKPLADFMQANRAKWATARDDKDALARLIGESFPDDLPSVQQLQQALESAWSVWDDEKDQSDAPKATIFSRIGSGFSGVGNFIVRNAAGLIAIGLAGVFLWIVYPIFGSGTLAQLRDESTARGSITFLFSLGTIFIALLLVTSALFGEGDDRNLREERFNRGKEVLTILIGILGTIVGFYFGTGSTDNTETNHKQLSVSQATITSTTPKAGDTVGIATYIGGGSPPYTYTIDVPDDLGIADPTGQRENDGVIFEYVAIPQSYGPGKEISFEVKVTDSTRSEKRTTGKFVTAKQD